MKPIQNQQQAAANLKPHGYRGPNRLMSAELSGSGGKVKSKRYVKPRPITPAGNVGSPPTSPDFGGTGLKVMGS
jgi:hypothetical protein